MNNINKEKCEKILEVFHDYLDKHPVPDILWSNKQQCWYYVRHYGRHMVDMEVIHTPEELCEMILYEIDADVYHEKDFHKIIGPFDDITPEVKAEALNRMEPYLEQLPEYAKLVYEIYN